MPEEVKVIISKKKSDFSNLKGKKSLTLNDEEKLISDMNILLGVYVANKTKEIERLIKNMIDFGKSKKWAVQGQIIELNRIKTGQLKVKRV